LKGLTGALEALASHVRSRASAVWLWQPDEGHDAPRRALPDLSRGRQLEVAARALLTIQYADGQLPHESRIAPGPQRAPTRG